MMDAQTLKEFEFRARLEAETETEDVAPKSLLDQIPGTERPGKLERKAQAAAGEAGLEDHSTEEVDAGILRKGLRYARKAADVVLEPITAIITAPLGEAAANFYGAGKEIAKGEWGQGTNKKYAEESGITGYQPRDPTAQAVVKGIGEALDKSKIAGAIPLTQELAAIGRLTGPSIRQAGRIAKREIPLTADEIVPSTGINIESIKDARRARLVAESTDPRDVIQAAYAKAQQKTPDGLPGYRVPPQGANPGSWNNITEALAGNSNVAKEISHYNTPLAHERLTRSVGLPNKTLTAEDFAKRHAELNTAYQEVADAVKDPVILDSQFIKKISSLRPGTEKSAAKYPTIFKAPDKLLASLEELKQPHSSQQILELVRKLREDSKKYLRGDTLEAADMGVAMRNAAAALDELLGRSLQENNPELFKRYTDARVTKAQLYDLEEAVDPLGVIDSRVLGALVKGKAYLTDELATTGQAAAVVPNAFIPAQLRAGAAIGGTEHLSAGMVRMLGHTDPAVTSFALLRSPLAKMLSAEWYQKGPGSGAKGLERTLAKRARTAPEVQAAPGLELAPEGPIPPTRPFAMKSPPEPRETLGMAGNTPGATPPESLLKSRHDVPTQEFPLRQEVIEKLQPTIDDFRERAALLKVISEKAINPAHKAAAAKGLAELEKKFGAGMGQLGVDNAADAHGLRRPLYQGGEGKTQLPLDKTFTMQPGSAKPRYTVMDAADYAKVPTGERYTAPDGTVRVKK